MTNVTFRVFIPLPRGGKVGLALGASEWYRHAGGRCVQVQDPVHTLLQPGQVNKLCVGRVGDEMHFWWRGLGWWDLKASLKILIQKEMKLCKIMQNKKSYV